MITNKPLESSNNLVDQAAASADRGIKATQRVANGALDALSDSVQGFRAEAAPALTRSHDKIAALARRSVDAMRDSSQQLREKVQRTSDSAVGYVKDEPVKAMLIAAAAGAVVMALIGLAARSRRP